VACERTTGERGSRAASGSTAGRSADDPHADCCGCPRRERGLALVARWASFPRAIANAGTYVPPTTKPSTRPGTVQAPTGQPTPLLTATRIAAARTPARQREGQERTLAGGERVRRPQARPSDATGRSEELCNVPWLWSSCFPQKELVCGTMAT
jgi:hypothetical protein